MPKACFQTPLVTKANRFVMNAEAVVMKTSAVVTNANRFVMNAEAVVMKVQAVVTNAFCCGYLQASDPRLQVRIHKRDSGVNDGCRLLASGILWGVGQKRATHYTTERVRSLFLKSECVFN